MVPHGSRKISPFNCVPVRIPGFDIRLTKWIGNENKHFTISMIILSFICSMVFGSVISYFTIKTYPDLLEGGRNVVYIKNPMELNSYIATISKKGGINGSNSNNNKGNSDRNTEKYEGPTSGTEKKM